jgi:flagellar basal-body rod modification protein FlgD
MSVSSILSSASTTNSSSSTSTKTNGQLNYQEFMKLLVVQLQNQNPLEPMNDRDFYAQMAQLGQVQSMEKLQQSMQVTQAQSLMGKTVTAQLDTPNADGTLSNVTGTVSKLTLKNGTYYVGLQTLDGGQADVKLENIQSVLPTQDMTQLSSLIGKTAEGTVIQNGAASAVSGSIVGIDSSSGAAMIRLQTSTGVVSLPLSNVSKIGG